MTLAIYPPSGNLLVEYTSDSDIGGEVEAAPRLSSEISGIKNPGDLTDISHNPREAPCQPLKSKYPIVMMYGKARSFSDQYYGSNVMYGSSGLNRVFCFFCSVLEKFTTKKGRRLLLYDE